MQKFWMILLAVLLATGLVFLGCDSSGGSKDDDDDDNEVVNDYSVTPLKDTKYTWTSSVKVDKALITAAKVNLVFSTDGEGKTGTAGSGVKGPPTVTFSTFEIYKGDALVKDFTGEDDYELKIGDNFEYGEGYQEEILWSEISATNVAKDDVYTLVLEFTVDRDLEGKLQYSIVDTTSGAGAWNDYWNELSEWVTILGEKEWALEDWFDGEYAAGKNYDSSKTTKQNLDATTALMVAGYSDDASINAGITFDAATGSIKLTNRAEDYDAISIPLRATDGLDLLPGNVRILVEGTAPEGTKVKVSNANPGWGSFGTATADAGGKYSITATVAVTATASQADAGAKPAITNGQVYNVQMVNIQTETPTPTDGGEKVYVDYTITSIVVCP